MNQFDGNDSHELKSCDWVSALFEALRFLGWGLIEEKDEEE